MKMTMTATGDSILIRPFQEGGYPGFAELRDYIARGQAKFANLETTVTDGDTYASAYCGGQWLNAPPAILPRLFSFGFNFVGFANNHTMDYGPDGCIETLAHVRKYDACVTGGGKDLGEASNVVYRDLPAGRVAFIAISSSFHEAAAAGGTSQHIKGRPGVNPLHFSAEYLLNEKHMAELKDIAKVTAINGQRDNSRRDGFIPPLPENVFEFARLPFRLSPDGTEGKRTFCNKNDLARTINDIRHAKEYADYVVIMLHSHQIRGASMADPDDFCVEFCRACVDAGADVILGGGTHRLKPIEIYKGKPIFYSIGDFFFQTDCVVREPYDQIVKNGGMEKRSGSKLCEQNCNYRSFIPYVEFEDGTLCHVELKPIELGFDGDHAHKGIPTPANEAVGREIYEHLCSVSEQFGTKLEFQNGIITVGI